MLILILFAILLLLAICLWIGVFSGSLSLHASDPAGNALASSFTALAAGAMWVLLAVLLIIAGLRGGMPTWCGIAALVLVPASGVAVQVAIQVLGRDRTLKWPAVFPGVVPGLMLAYAIWCFASKGHELVSPTTAGAVVWGTIALLTPLPWIIKRSLVTRSSGRC
jgi:hypothetical protein